MEQQFLNEIECKVCKNQDKTKFSPKFYKNEVNIVQCNECGFVFIPPYYRKQINYCYVNLKLTDIIFSVLSEHLDS